MVDEFLWPGGMLLHGRLSLALRCRKWMLLHMLCFEAASGVGVLVKDVFFAV